MANRKLRNKVSGRLKNFSAEDLEDYVDFELNDVSNPYSFRKDGKSRHTSDEFETESDFYKKVLRK